MKKIMMWIFAVVLVGCCSVTVQAQEAPYATAGEWYEAWCDELPDYIGGVWSTDGGTSCLTFGIQNTEEGNKGMETMLASVQNDATLTFVYQEHSRNDLLRIQRELDAYLSTEAGLVSTALDDCNNCIILGVLKERKDDADVQNTVKEITEKYGTAVTVEYTGAVFSYTADGIEDPLQPYGIWLWAVSSVLALTVGVFLVFRKRKTALLRTNVGETVRTTASPSAKEVENMVRNVVCDVPLTLEQKIMSEIHKAE